MQNQKPQQPAHPAPQPQHPALTVNIPQVSTAPPIAHPQPPAAPEHHSLFGEILQGIGSAVNADADAQLAEQAHQQEAAMITGQPREEKLAFLRSFVGSMITAVSVDDDGQFLVEASNGQHITL